MTRIYTLSDAHAWAEFSGDNNPIHFDKAYSIAAGLEQLTVHGMRTMQDLKLAVSSEAILAQEAPAWWRFAARLRAPLFYDQPYRLASSNTCGVAQASLVDWAGAVKMTCKLQAGEEPVVGEVRERKHLAVHDKDRQQFSMLFGDNNKTIPGWLFFDALLFRELIDAPYIVTLLSPLLSGIEGRGLLDIFRRFTVVQTHHEVWFNNILLAACGETLPVQLTGCEYYLPVVIGDLATGATVSFMASLSLNEQSAIYMAVTLKITSGQVPSL